MKKTFLIFALCCLLYTVTPVFAQTEYQLLAPLPLDGAGSAPAEETTAGPYLEGIFTLIIAIAGGLAVIKIIFGGIKYMSTDAFSGKSEARSTIENAIWGLLLAISAWLILFTVNPDLVKFDLSIPRQEIRGSVSRGGGNMGGGPILGIGPDHLVLTQQEAISAFGNTNIAIAGPISLAGIRQGVVNEIVRLKNACNCNVVITSVTGGEHDTTVQPTCNHRNGYKVDLRSRAEGTALTNYIQNNYQPLPNRSDGAKMYISPTGVFYALEGSHWDVARC